MRRLLSIALIAVLLLAASVELASAQSTGAAPVIKGRFVGTGSGTAPTLSSCGTATVAGNDTAGVITFTAGATACTLTFNEAFSTRPSCWAFPETDPGAARADNYVRKIVSTTTAVVFTFESKTGDADTYEYGCVGR